MIVICHRWRPGKVAAGQNPDSTVNDGRVSRARGLAALVAGAVVVAGAECGPTARSPSAARMTRERMVISLLDDT